MKRILILLLFSLGHVLLAQPSYVASNYIPVMMGDSLQNAWVGGVNSSTFASFDFDADGSDDLLVLDRAHDRGLVFLAKNGKYQYSAHYSLLLPELQKYALFYDYDRDGRKDLFTATFLGIKAYRNTATQNNVSFETVASPIFTFYPPDYANMNITLNDIPTLSDLDNDGDMDILHFNSTSGASLVWERNMSVEKYGKPDSLDFKQTDDCWGGFQEQLCKTYYFGFNCKNNFRLEHVGAGAVLAFDTDNDGDKDILIGKEDCSNLNFIENKGNSSTAFFNKLNSAFPSPQPIEQLLYPISFLEDIDFDSKKDLIISTGSEMPDETDLSKNMWWYKNTGTNEIPVFSFQSKDFLQNTMIDLGQNTHPAFADKDGDGDLDLFISNSTNQTSAGASIFYFENTGNISSPSFVLRDSNYLNLASSLHSEIEISFSDLNNDSKTDLILVSAKDNAIATSIYYNQANVGLEFGSAIPLDISLTEIAAIQFHDLNNDNLQDALVGNSSGNVIHFKNTGTISAPIFTLVTNYFGAIENSETQIGITIADVDSDDKPDLISAADNGTMMYYSDFKSQTNPFLGQKLSDHMPNGYRLSIASADLDHDKMPEMVIGNDNGGLQLLINDQVLSILRDAIKVDSEIKIYPNPTTGSFEMQTSKSGEMQIKDLFGKLLFAKYLEANQKSNLELNLEKGIYIVSFERGETKKLIVNR